MTGKTSVKATLRGEMRARLGKMSSDERISESKSIRDQLIFPPGSKVALFAGTRTEPQLLDLIVENRQIAWFLPRVTGGSTMEFLRVCDLEILVEGPFGIREPPTGEPAPDLDFIICPGLAFTSSGHRLGQGGGYYDRALSRYPTARRLGAAFSCQLRESLPIEPHDLAMEDIIRPRSEL